ncbi:hypothetical protein [Pseudonocardia sp. GCM10023141]|uniref:hypothetical protein n=1 Tax=Pseudonocardia sp. GCM10023141 TaxID=3252653 RepID=UPI00361A78A1
MTAALATIGTVSTLEDWIARSAVANDATSTSIFLVISGLGGPYALIGVINAVMIGAASRRQEFAASRGRWRWW